MNENTVKFPVDKLVSPSIFKVKVDVGTKVYFHHKGYLIEGTVQGYFGHITPDKTLDTFSDVSAEVSGENFEAKPAQVSNIGYAVVYFVPNPEPFSSDKFVRQVQVLDESEFFLTKEELIDSFMKSHYLSLPDDVDPSNTDSHSHSSSMRKKSIINIPTGTVRGSEEEKLQKQEKNRSQKDKIASYLELLSKMKQK